MNDYLIQFALLRERAYRETQNPELFQHLLICTELTGNYSDSRELYEEILDQHPYCSFAWFNLGWVFSQLNATVNALDAFEYAYITQPYYEEAYRAFGELACQQGFFRRALQCYEEMSGRVEPDSDVLTQMSRCQLRLGDMLAAKKLCRQALRLDPYHAEALHQLGACFAAANEFRPAARWFREAIRADDRREDFHCALAGVYTALGQGKKALIHYQRAVELAPEEASIWLQLADCLLLAGHAAQAQEVLEQALEHATGAELLYCSAACKFLAGDRPGAVLTLQQALAADINSQTSIFRWAPTLRDDAEVVGLLNSFQ